MFFSKTILKYLENIKEIEENLEHLKTETNLSSLSALKLQSCQFTSKKIISLNQKDLNFTDGRIFCQIAAVNWNQHKNSKDSKSFFSGFLGLLMGGSFLSLVEIFYYFTLRRVFRSHNTKTVEKTESEHEFKRN